MFLHWIIKIFHPTIKPSTTQWETFFFHAILVIKRDKSLNKLIKGFDVPTEQLILQQFICLSLNCSKKVATVQPPAPVQSLVHLPQTLPKFSLRRALENTPMAKLTCTLNLDSISTFFLIFFFGRIGATRLAITQPIFGIP